MVQIEKMNRTEEQDLRAFFKQYAQSEHPEDAAASETYPFIENSGISLRHVLVAKDGGSIIGAVILTRSVWQMERFTTRIDIGVLPAKRKQGIGRRLLHAAEALADEMGIWRIETLLSVRNRPALLLFGTSGYQVEAMKTKALSLKDGMSDAFYMAKILK